MARSTSKVSPVLSFFDLFAYPWLRLVSQVQEFRRHLRIPGKTTKSRLRLLRGTLGAQVRLWAVRWLLRCFRCQYLTRGNISAQVKANEHRRAMLEKTFRRSTMHDRLVGGSGGLICLQQPTIVESKQQQARTAPIALERVVRPPFCEIFCASPCQRAGLSTPSAERYAQCTAGIGDNASKT